jgi:hypothetical protein
LDSDRRLSQAVPSPSTCQSIFVAIVDDPAGRQRITPGKIMNAIPTEGLFEAYLELRAQMNDAARAKKQTPPGWEQT